MAYLPTCTPLAVATRNPGSLCLGCASLVREAHKHALIPHNNNNNKNNNNSSNNSNNNKNNNNNDNNKNNNNNNNNNNSNDNKNYAV